MFGAVIAEAEYEESDSNQSSGEEDKFEHVSISPN